MLLWRLRKFLQSMVCKLEILRSLWSKFRSLRAFPIDAFPTESQTGLHTFRQRAQKIQSSSTWLFCSGPEQLG